MVRPLRRYLLNREIGLWARDIACRHTVTCRGDSLIDFADEHTRTCNKLKAEIEALVMQVKLAALQRPLERGRAGASASASDGPLEASDAERAGDGE